MSYQTYEQKVFALTGPEIEYGPLNRSAIIKLNRAMRELDESHLWPISGRFNATDRAIRRVRRHLRDGCDAGPLEYVLHVDDQISRIVNNW